MCVIVSARAKCQSISAVQSISGFVGFGNLGCTAACYSHKLADENVIRNPNEFEQALMDVFVPEDH